MKLGVIDLVVWEKVSNSIQAVILLRVLIATLTNNFLLLLQAFKVSVLSEELSSVGFNCFSISECRL